VKEEDIAKLRCSFCGKNQREVRKLIAGPTVYICNECIGLCNDIIAEDVDVPAESEGEFRRRLVARLKSHEVTLARLVDVVRRNSDLLSSEVKDALTDVELASARLAQAVFMGPMGSQGNPSAEGP